LFDSTAPSGSEDTLIQDVNNELRIKQVQLRQMQHQIDVYQGKATAINAYSKAELAELEDEIGQTLGRIRDRKMQ